ncbi:uncharacterized protein DUF4296 [Winogradskyella epiphytica]|uniref:Uncharacterized protein DUF4296 n=1 Tax=Winogradskyella epiphytica TaxID=262005 RepID=A0A2V4XW25_9FLAO|nr:DUF4296 domain-containing protein [Winogradskyella epiphytica]PYE83007.1 uncharacterized protein DUF4296 [Winogradskyella epiphytica]
MLKHIIIIVAIGSLLISCNSSDAPKKPNPLLSKSQMSELLYDLYVINGAKSVNRTLLEVNGFKPETYILEKYNIDSTQFADNNIYYAYDAESYKEIVVKVKERLEREKKALEVIRDRESDSLRKRRDSLRKEGDNLKEPLNEESNKTAVFQ